MNKHVLNDKDRKLCEDLLNPPIVMSTYGTKESLINALYQAYNLLPLYEERVKELEAKLKDQCPHVYCGGTNEEHCMSSINSEYDRLEKHLKQCMTAMQTFVDRVDRGEAKSVKTYNQFKEILSNIDI